MIVTVTMNPAIDVSTSVDRVEPDRKLRCDQPMHEAGGGGINVSRAIHRLGGESVAVWTSGGLTGERLEEILGREGIEQRPIPVPGLTRENLIVEEQSTGRQFRFGMPGPSIIRDEASRVCEMLRSFDASYLVASGSLPPGLGDDWYVRVGQCADSCGGRFILDTSGPALRRAVEQGVWLIKLNHRELCDLVGCELEDDQQLEDAARQLILDGKVEYVLVSLGAGGALLVTRDTAESFRAPTVPIRSTVGAGDSMMAGLVHSLEQGRDMSESVRYAVAAGAAAVMTPGTGLCRLEDVERLFGGTEALAPA